MEQQTLSIHIYFEEYIGFFLRFNIGKASVILLLLGWILYSKFISKGDWRAFQYVLKEVAVTQGNLNASEVLGIQIDNQDVSRVFFSYNVDEKMYFGDGYIVGRTINQSTTVDVTYVVKEPYISRISGTRNAPYGPSVFLWSIVPLAGFIFFILGTRKAFRMAQLLSQGIMTTGHRVRKGVVDKVSIYPLEKISYAYEIGNSSFEYHKWTSQSINYREKETLVYVDRPPYYAMLCKDFPKNLIVAIEQTHGVSLNS